MSRSQKTSMNGLEVFVAADILGECLSGAKVEKVFQTDDGIFAFDLFSGTLGKKFLIVMEDFVYLTDRKPKAPDEPPGFCMLLRKHLCGNCAITGVSQLGFDRILSIGFSNGQTLVCEIFDGNLILLDPGGIIVAALRKKRWRTRAIFPGEKYEPPPGPLDPRAFGEKFVPKKKELVKALAADFGLGGILAEEICIRAGVEKLGTLPTREDTGKISEAILKLFDEAAAGGGFSYFSDTVSSPVRLHLAGEKAYPDFFKAMEAVSKNRSESEAKAVVEREASKAIEKQRELIERQKKLLEKYGEDAETSRRAGDELIASLPAVDSMIAKARELGWDAAIKIPGVKNADRKSGKITLETGKSS